MNDLKRIILLVSLLYITGCASVGPKIIIETPEPAEDFVVLCQWYKNTIFSGGHGGKSKVGQDVYVTESGKEVNCGISLTGSDGLVLIKHPVYVLGDGKENYTKDGVKHIVMNKTKLDLLDKQKTKFEAGHWNTLSAPGWDKDKTPAQRYVRSIGRCGFGHQYLDYYSQVNKVDKTYFKNKYNEFLLKCNKFAFNEMLKNDLEFSKKTLNVEQIMKLIWKPEKWSKYE